MTTNTMANDDDAAKAVLKDLEKIIEDAGEQQAIDSVFVIAVKVGAWLVTWRNLMVNEGKFSEQWAEDTAMILFHKFFPPPENGWVRQNDEDDDD